MQRRSLKLRESTRQRGQRFSRKKYSQGNMKRYKAGMGNIKEHGEYRANNELPGRLTKISRIPLRRAQELSATYNVAHLLAPLLEFDPAKAGNVPVAGPRKRPNPNAPSASIYYRTARVLPSWQQQRMLQKQLVAWLHFLELLLSLTFNLALFPFAHLPIPRRLTRHTANVSSIGSPKVQLQSRGTL